jgi:hypothetical protein
MKNNKQTNMNARRSNYTTTMLMKSENYMFDYIEKGLIHSGNLDSDIEQSISSIRDLRKKYHDKVSPFAFS